MPRSAYLHPGGRDWIESWQQDAQAYSTTLYTALTVPTAWGDTRVYASGHTHHERPALICWPGFRTCSMFWDIHDTIQLLTPTHRVYLVDVIGQPGLSALDTPPLWSDGYGQWMQSLMDGLGLAEADMAGASFGGYLIGKLAATAPERIRRAVLVASAGLAPLYLSWYMIEANMRPILSPSEAEVDYFLDRMIFRSPDHVLDEGRHIHIRNYELYVMRHFRLSAYPPVVLEDHVWRRLTSPVLVIHGEHDRMFKASRVAARAQKVFSALEDAVILPGHAHGLEVSARTFELMRDFLAG
ncbi:MAG: alpha/beta fold hydrolase [Bacteroidia bacterium]|nr:alpha/beta fold hydrolase [Bacteroidia bacterium]